MVFLAGLTHSTLGFGSALVAMPALALTLGLPTATPLVAFVGLTIAMVLMWTTWRDIDLRSVWRLLVSSAAGIPIGLVLLTRVDQRPVKAGLGILIVLFSVYRLARPKLGLLRREGWAFGFGLLAGILGGAYNTHGPPLVLYGALSGWSPKRFRSTMQGYFVLAGLLIWLGHGLAGLWTQQVLCLYLIGLPLVLAGIVLGAQLNRRIQPERFQKVLFVVLILLGLGLLGQSILQAFASDGPPGARAVDSLLLRAGWALIA